MDKEILKQTVLSFLQSHRKAVLATVGDDEHPTTSLMLYAVDDNFDVYFGTRKAFGKFATFTRHPYASLSVIEESLDPMKTVEMRGRIEFVPEEETKERLSWFTSKNQSKYFIKDEPDFIMFRVVPSFVRWLDASSGNIVMEHVELS